MNLLKVIKKINTDTSRAFQRPDKVTALLDEFYHYLKFLSIHNLDKDTQKELNILLAGYEVEYKTDKWLSYANSVYATSDLFKDSLLSVYPKFGTIKSKLYPLITGDLDKLFEDYAKKIGYSIDTHKEVLDIVQWAKDKELLNIGIEKFISSYFWDSLKELRGKDDITIGMIADDF